MPFGLNLRMGAVVRKTKHVMRGLELSVPHPDLWGRERSWRLKQLPMDNDLINHACVLKPPQTPKKDRNLESFQVGEHMEIHGEWLAWRGHGNSEPFPHTLPSRRWIITVYPLGMGGAY